MGLFCVTLPLNPLGMTDKTSVPEALTLMGFVQFPFAAQFASGWLPQRVARPDMQLSMAKPEDMPAEPNLSLDDVTGDSKADAERFGDADPKYRFSPPLEAV